MLLTIKTEQITFLEIFLNPYGRHQSLLCCFTFREMPLGNSKLFLSVFPSRRDDMWHSLARASYPPGHNNYTKGGHVAQLGTT